MADVDPKLKALILAVPAIMFAAIAVGWGMQEGSSVNVELAVIGAPVGFGIGWIILNVYNVAEAV